MRPCYAHWDAGGCKDAKRRFVHVSREEAIRQGAKIPDLTTPPAKGTRPAAPVVLVARASPVAATPRAERGTRVSPRGVHFHRDAVFHERARSGYDSVRVERVSPIEDDRSTMIDQFMAQRRGKVWALEVKGKLSTRTVCGSRPLGDQVIHYQVHVCALEEIDDDPYAQMFHENWLCSNPDDSDDCPTLVEVGQSAPHPAAAGASCESE